MQDQIDDQIEMLNTANQMGIPVKFVEMGNEWYDNDNPTFPDGVAYANALNQWIPALRSAFEPPLLHIGVCAAASVTLGANPKELNWNNQLFSNLTAYYNYVVLHIYPVHGNQLPAISQIPQFIQSRGWEWYANILAGNLNYSTTWNIPSGKRIWITEYALLQRFSNQAPNVTNFVAGTWTHALTNATISLQLLRLNQTRLMDFNTICSGPMDGAIYPNNTAYSTAGKFSPSGKLLQLIGKALDAKTTAHELFPYNIPDDFGQRPLVGWLFQGSSDITIVIVNIMEESKSLDLTVNTLARPLQVLVLRCRYKFGDSVDGMCGKFFDGFFEPLEWFNIF